MNDFKVGDICIGQNFIIQTCRNGEECEIIGGLKERSGRNPITKIPSVKLMYRVRWSDSTIAVVTPNKLRKKNSPKRDTRDIDKVVSWEDCGWQPSKEPASLTS